VLTFGGRDASRAEGEPDMEVGRATYATRAAAEQAMRARVEERWPHAPFQALDADAEGLDVEDDEHMVLAALACAYLAGYAFTMRRGA
jgi:hypothetical protein